MSSAGLGAVTDVKTMLSSSWTSVNTDSKTPSFWDNLETLWEQLDFGARDQLYIKNDIETVKTGLYAADFTHAVSCTIEVMTARSTTPAAGRAHFKKMVDETMRIIKANARLSGYAKVVISSGKYRYIRDKQIFIGAVEVDLLKINTS
jgi:hypothetical protein